MKKIIVSDVTFKTIEEQNISLSFREKLLLCEKLDNVNVDAIELPVLKNSKENEVIYRTMASSVKNATVKIAVGDNAESVKTAFNCIEKSSKKCLQVVMPVSTVQMEYFYHLKASAMLEKIVELVSIAKTYCDEVEFVALDATRAEQGFVGKCAQAVCGAGATAITVCDTEGVAFPEDFEKLIKEIKLLCDVKVFVQPSDNLKLATACAIQSIKAGADGVKTTVCDKYLSLPVVSDLFKNKGYNLDATCGVDATNVKTVSNVINTLITEKMDVEETVNNSVNVENSATLKDVAKVIKNLGYELSDGDVGKVYEEFKKVTDKKETIDAKELEAIIASTAMQVPSTYHLVNYVVNSGNIIPATANVTLEKDGEKFTGVSTGDGPIDAAFHAIEQVIGHHYELDDFQVQAVTKGRGAVGSSLIRLRADGKLYSGNGVSTDIIGACIRAYINALNKIVYEEK